MFCARADVTLENFTNFFSKALFSSEKISVL